MKTIDCDYLVVGSGIAGLTAALELSERGKVLVLTKKDASETNTSYAQGGIACVMKQDDSFEQHVADTLRAGDGLCDSRVVESIISKAPDRIADLERFGVAFTEYNDGPDRYDLGKEGGHSKRRILHSGDITGKHIQSGLLKQARSTPGITIRERTLVIDLITMAWLDSLSTRNSLLGHTDPESNRAAGVYAMECDSGEIIAVRSPYVILATGGGGKVYLYTSNPDVATGDGVAIAWRAGVPIRNMEFIQFHPTCLFHPEAKSFLVSEAVRGEGAKLVLGDGSEFMYQYDERGALASRDIVARAIDHEMKSRGESCVYLDIRDRGEAFIRERFPTIYDTCMQFGFDMARDLIPVVPAAHYFCGGIDAAINGSTAMPGLFACGEVACTGLHGANRLASNSLLEAAVCGHELAQHLVELPPASDYKKVSVPDWEPGDAVPSDEAIVVEHNWNEVRTCMWDYVGIVRTDKRLERAAHRIGNLHHEIYDYYKDYLVMADILELRNIAAVAELIVCCAQQRKESRGLHYTLDYPDLSSEPSEDSLIRDDAGSYRKD